MRTTFNELMTFEDVEHGIQRVTIDVGKLFKLESKRRKFSVRVLRPSGSLTAGLIERITTYGFNYRDSLTISAF